ncbi:MAG: hypothetical protein NTW93_00275 [Phycisphaerae bacterium]|nr:hypothetical protein [Phycisphaerae bacterium]
MINNFIKRFESDRIGSALIMTVVLTVLLSIIAVMFVAVARMDMASTGNIADNKMLESSVKSIIELINWQLVLDVPGAAGQEYYDYPDANDAWLASIEPYESASGIYKWRQISDVTNYLHQHSYPTTDVDTDPPGIREVIKDYPEIKLNPDGTIQNNDTWADADGDGIADSKWFELANMRSSKGKQIFAAVRIIDNSGMVNINTAHEFNANDPNISEIDGSGQMQVNLNGLLKGIDTINTLHNTRCGGSGDPNRNSYTQNVIWQYGEPNGNYFPFDISDELELKYRYCIDSKFKCRFETSDPCTAKTYGNPGSLYDASSNWGLGDWQNRVAEPNNIDRRHMLTALNLDRIIDPAGSKMTNINTADVDALYRSIRRGIIDACDNFPDVNKIAAQLAVNIIDYRDSNSNVTVFHNSDNDSNYYGFERPCIYISELAYRGGVDGNSYAIELYKPYPEDANPDPNWQLIIKKPASSDITVSITNWSGTSQFYVIDWNDPCCPLNAINIGQEISNIAHTEIFNGSSTILLTRRVNDVNVVVDSVPVPGSWMIADGNSHSLQRDITPAKCIRRSWDPNTNGSGSPTLGSGNPYLSSDSNFIQAHPKNGLFTNIGEIGMILRKAAYYPAVGGSNNGVIGYDSSADVESEVRLNLADPNFQKIFKYLTVWPPSYVSDQNETKIKGRININTAPTYVLAQLPWVSLRSGTYNDPNLAKAIVAYRDKMAISGGPDYRGSDPCGFRNIGQLCDVNLGSTNYSINYYGRDGFEQVGFPDLDPNDGAVDDFKERDLIFTRISDLVTVRSDVFTAYILVRIGTDGPQRRVVTILDRSDVKPSDYWTQWTSAAIGTPGTAAGTISELGVNVSYNGEIQGSLVNPPPSWQPMTTFSGGTIRNPPPVKFGSIKLQGDSAAPTNTIFFSKPVVDPIMAIWSLGCPGTTASFVFQFPPTQPTIESGGPSAENSNGTSITRIGNTISGVEGSGTIKFHGTFQWISWTCPVFESNYAFTIGASGQAGPVLVKSRVSVKSFQATPEAR